MQYSIFRPYGHTAEISTAPILHLNNFVANMHDRGQHFFNYTSITCTAKYLVS